MVLHHRLTSAFRQLGEVSRSVLGTLVLSAFGLVGIASYEGYSNNAIIPVPGDVPTLGFGTTQGVKMGDKTTPDRALRRLYTDVDKASAAIRSCVHVPLSQGEFDEYTGLAYNIGTSNFCGSTLVKLLNQQQYIAACQQILRWDRASGRQLPGLTKRRQGEHARCMAAAEGAA